MIFNASNILVVLLTNYVIESKYLTEAVELSAIGRPSSGIIFVVGVCFAIILCFECACCERYVRFCCPNCDNTFSF